ncbi:MAG: hypothetical protein Q8L20_01445 [Gammaproteobacteria bacterium]|nr:hypothetical protein [Gammaproteobacteria bacterium]
MTFNRNSLFSAVAAATLGFSALCAQAAEPALTAATASGAATTATFTGGATTNNGSTYTTTAASSAAIDAMGTIKVAAADVGKAGALVALVNVSGMGAFQMVSGGFFLPWNGQVSGLAPFAVKTLAATERVTVMDDLIGKNSNLAGLDFQIFFGYYTGNNINTLAYTATPISFSIAATPAAGCPTNTTLSTGGTFEGKPVCVLTGTITSNTHLNANNVYLLNGAVFIGGDNTNSATLTIDAGTKVISPVGLNFLVIRRGSKIVANGSEASPIVFTYDGDATATATTTGRWGGIIINGNAPVNGCAAGTTLCELEGEGSTGKYGGNNPTDNSGVLNYVIVKYPGQNITETNELNGIAFQGVGSGTLVDYVQVHGSSDDGVEFFGGTVNAKHLILTSNEDDSFDWTFGYSGKVQHAIVKQRAAFGDRGIEADNNEFAFDSLPRSKPTLANFTFIGRGAGGRGIELRRGTGANIHNTVVTGFDLYCLDLNDNATFTNGGSSATSLTGQLTMTHSRFACANNFAESGTDPWSVAAWFNGQTGNSTGTADLSGVINGPGLNAIPAATLNDSFFDAVTHIGAVKDQKSDWASAWMFN